MRNQKISKEDLDFVRSLEDRDLIMLISDINDNGWHEARRLLLRMREALGRGKQKQSTLAFEPGSRG